MTVFQHLEEDLSPQREKELQGDQSPLPGETVLYIITGNLMNTGLSIIGEHCKK